MNVEWSQTRSSRFRPVNQRAVQKVVVNGHHQQAFAADGEQDLQQQGLQQHLGRHPRSSARDIHRLRLALMVASKAPTTRHIAQLAQRVFGTNSLFKADVAEHRLLEILCASHLECRLRFVRGGSHVVAADQPAGDFFNGLLKS